MSNLDAFLLGWLLGVGSAVATFLVAAALVIQAHVESEAHDSELPSLR